MSRMRTLIVCPGRGSYGRDTLGSLKDRSPAAQRVIDACDAHRSELGRPTVSALDAEASFRGSKHVAGEHASLLTFACSLADLADIDRDRYEIVGVCGNSMGWYTALAASGALPLESAVELVETMAAYQAGNVIGGQIMYPVCGEDWQRDPSLLAAVEAAIEAARSEGGRAWWSIDLGSHAVLGADSAGLAALRRHLAPLEVGTRTFPIQLPLHSAFHTPLLDATSDRARADLDHLAFSAPDVPLIDGRGQVFRPRWASPDDLADYTLGHQVVDVYDLALSVRTALHHCGPDVVVTLGPGNALGGPIARMLVQEGWRGHRTREAFDAAQRTDPLLRSFGVRPQRALLT